MSASQTNGHATQPSFQTQFNASASRKPNKRKRPSPVSVSVRFNQTELDRLKAEAGAKSLNGYIRERLFGSSVKARRVPTRTSSADPAILSRLLRDLGNWDLTWALKELDVSVKDGVLRLDPETCTFLRQACADIAIMRHDLTRTLGLRVTCDQ